MQQPAIAQGAGVFPITDYTIPPVLLGPKQLECYVESRSIGDIKKLKL